MTKIGGERGEHTEVAKEPQSTVFLLHLIQMIGKKEGIIEFSIIRNCYWNWKHMNLWNDQYQNQRSVVLR